MSNINIASPRVAWEMWRARLGDLSTLSLARAFVYAAGCGWARGELLDGVITSEDDAIEVLRTRSLYVALTYGCPTSEISAADTAEIKASLALAPTAWQARTQHGSLRAHLRAVGTGGGVE